jgi:hypothetical protein
VQLVEVSLIGIRSAVITLRRDQTPLRFVLFPMVHLGAPAFYREVEARLAQCQLIVAEGVAGRSLLASTLTLAYRLPARGRRGGLVVQQIKGPAGTAVIQPDVTAAEFKSGMREVPLRQRVLVYCLVPPVAVAFWLLGPRRVFARYLRSLDDLPSAQDLWIRERAGDLVEQLVDRRDAKLVEALATIHDERQDEQLDVAVVYGAEHMAAVVHQLAARYGYRPRSAEWLTVAEF